MVLLYFDGGLARVQPFVVKFQGVKPHLVHNNSTLNKVYWDHFWDKPNFWVRTKSVNMYRLKPNCIFG
jgi:hypothetical protein